MTIESKKSNAQVKADAYLLGETLEFVPKVAAFIEEYWTHPEKWQVFPNAKPGDTLKKLPKEMPVIGEKLETIFTDFQELIVPGLLHWSHPGFFGFFQSNTSGPSLLGAMLTASLNVNPFSWNAGPSATELEMRLVEWLSQALGLSWPGSLQDTASSSTFCAVIAARERAFSTRQAGLLSAPRLRAYVSTEAHSSVVKAIYLAGLGRDCVRMIDTLEDLSMDPKALRQAIERDLTAGDKPFFVCSTLGSTSSTAFDDVAAIAAVCEATCKNIWHHVDAALAGSAALLPEMASMMQGVSRADSFLFNPHKWLFTHFECSVLLVKNKKEYMAALSENPAYLQNTFSPDSGNETEVEDFRNWSVQLGRGFRGLKLWFVLRAYGLQRIQNMIRKHLALTEHLYELFQKDRPSSETFILLQKPKLNTICFRLSSNDLTQQFYKKIQERRIVYLTSTKIKGTTWIRVAIGQTAVLQDDVDTLWAELKTVRDLMFDAKS